MRYFAYDYDLTMTNDRFAKLFGHPRRGPEAAMEQFHWDMAASIQKVTEEIVLRIVRDLHERTGMKNLCMAGGVALNCVANGRIVREGPFENLWVQPAAGDAGGALGAALFLEQLRARPTRALPHGPRLLGTPVLGRSIRTFLDERGATLPHALPRRDDPRDGPAARRGAGGGRMVPGAHGVGSARARQPLASWPTPATRTTGSAST
jgi:carbamoyltransferase